MNNYQICIDSGHCLHTVTGRRLVNGEVKLDYEIVEIADREKD